MDTTDAQPNKRGTLARYQFTQAEEMAHEEDDADAWSTRMPSSARRYQKQADVRTETGRIDDVQPLAGRNRYTYQASQRRSVPPRRTATEEHMSALPAVVSSPAASEVERTPAKSHAQRRRPGDLHWLIFVGLTMLIMILGWVALSALGSWWQTTSNDWRYGRPRTFQVDAVVGHNDSLQNPSHFLAMNLNRHIVIIEIPGGNVAKSVVYSGPTLVGPGQDLTPVTLTFRDLNHDGKPDMIVNIQGSQFIFLNEHGTFVPASQNATASP